MFLEHLSEKEQEFYSKYYIIRTFEDYKIDNDLMVSDVGVFTGLQKEVLLNAVGILSAEEMAKQFGTTVEEIESVYRILNEKCLVYMTEF